MILEDEYQDPGAGQEIPEENIESYFVWIPKYSYKLWDLGEYESDTPNLDTTKVHAIEIRFGLTNTTDSKSGECTTLMNTEETQGLSGEKGNCKVGDYMTHPAFISFNVNGIWVGKFKTGYKSATNTSTAQINPSDETNAKAKVSEVIIKPDKYIWSNIQLAKAFTISYNYERNLDSHMMKNTEWGAVAYLSHSIYGTCNNEECQEVVLNNTSDYKTGYAAINPPTSGELTNISCSEQPDDCNEQGPSTNNQITTKWNTKVGQNGSSNGNISGIYDLAGPVGELVMALTYDNDNKGILVGVSQSETTGFKGKYGRPNENEATEATTGIEIPGEKYYDIYSYSAKNNTFNRRILGDATGEMGPFKTVKFNTLSYNIHESSWHHDEIWMPYNGKPSYSRGGGYKYGISSGIFRGNDHAGASGSFRIVLAPN